MKNKKIIIILLLILSFTACQKNNSNYETLAQDKVNNNIIDKTNVTESSIKESIDYIKNNIETDYTSLDKENFYYHATYLKTISLDNSPIRKLSQDTLDYLDTNKSQYKNTIFEELENITTNDITEAYQNYHIQNTIAQIITDYELEITSVTSDTSKIQIDDLSKAYDYIESHIENPLEDEEVIEKTVYYGLYLSKLGESNQLKELGTKTISYLQTFDSSTKEEIIKLLNLDKNTIISSSYQEITKE